MFEPYAFGLYPAEVFPLRKWPFTVLLSLCLFIPLAFAVPAFDRFNTPKLVLFLFGSGLLLIWELKNFQGFRELPVSVKWAAGFFLAVELFQMVRLADWSTGLIGKYGQSESFLVQAGFLVMGAAAYRFTAGEAERSRLRRVLMLVTFFICCFGIGEYFGGDPIARQDVTRVKSFFGDPNSLGAFLILTLPLIFKEWQETPKRSVRYFAAGCILLGSATLILTFSRASWLRFLVGLALFILFQAVGLTPKKLLKIIVIATVIWGISWATGSVWVGGALFYLLILLGMAWNTAARRPWVIGLVILVILGATIGQTLTYFQPRQHSDYELKARVTSIAQGNDSGRGLLWSIGWRIFQESPWIGHGLGSFRDNFHRFETQAAVKFWGPDRDLDQSHNEPLHYLATQGILGFLAYFGLLLAILASTDWRGLLRRNLSLSETSLFCACLSYMIFVNFGYALVHYTFIFWIELGLLLGYRHPAPQIRTSPTLIPTWLLPLALWIFIIGGGWILGNMFLADLNYRTAFHQARRHQFEESLGSYRLVIARAPLIEHYHYRYALTLFRAAKWYQKQGGDSETADQYSRQSRAILLRLRRIHPDEYQLNFLLGQEYENGSEFQEAAAYYRQALIQFPENYRLYIRLAKAEWLGGNKLASRRAFDAGFAMNPEYAQKAAIAEGLPLP